VFTSELQGNGDDGITTVSMVIRGNRDKDDGITTEMRSVVCGNTAVIIIA